MIGDAEDKLLLAVRNAIRSGLSLEDSQCTVEYDELYPATSGDRYIIITPGGVRADARHHASGAVHALIYSVDITVVRRLGHVPRDRRRDVFAFNLSGLNDMLAKVYEIIDWSYDVTGDANLSIASSEESFVHPLVFESVEPKPRTVAPSDFGANGSDVAALARTARFSNALLLTGR